jgi:hypothetical protein
MNIKIELKQINAFQEDKFHILPTLSRSPLNKFDISDLSPTPLKPQVIGAFFMPNTTEELSTMM